jgi:molybdate transport system permease protein
LATFLVLPLLGLFAAPGTQVLEGLRHPLVWPALRLSLFTTGLTVLIVAVLGTPLAFVLARAHGRLARLLETLLQLPIVVPPAVAGIALLLTFGRRGLWHHLFPDLAWSPTFTPVAVVMAEVFVAAPYYLQAAVSAFRRIDEDLITVARSLGASPHTILIHLAIPASKHGLVSGAALSWARALGEFGATLMFAGNLEGRTQTLPLAIYAALETDVRVAQSLSVVLVAVSLFLLLVVRFTAQKTTRETP